MQGEVAGQFLLRLGGVAVADVRVNDTLNGNPVVAAEVTLSQVSTTNPGVTLDPATGAVNVAPGTPAGTYTLTYELCELLNPTNCDQANVTVTVTAAPIDCPTMTPEPSERCARSPGMPRPRPSSPKNRRMNSSMALVRARFSTWEA